MLITMAFTLLSTRWILEALGASDFGIYNLIAGIITMLSFLNTAMSVGTQRNLSFLLGKGEIEALKETFACSIQIHIGLGLIIFILLESVGIYYLNNALNIPQDRMLAANTILHIMSISMFITIAGVPYLASINSHEDMIVVAITNIFEAVWKFALALFLLSYTGDRLITYAILILVMTACTFLAMLFYSLRHYEETRISLLKKYSISRIKYLLNYSTWNVVGSLGLLIKGQGIAFLLNTFSSVVVNAAYGVAQQVNGQMSFFSNSVIRAFNPQIISSEGAGDHERMIRLSFMSCKISTTLLFLIIVPLMFNLDLILNLWLKNVPELSIEFTFLILVHSIIYQMYHGMELSIHASGHIKFFSVAACLLNILAIPISYILLKMEFPLITVLFVSIVCNIANMYNVAYNSQKNCGIKITTFYNHVVLPLCVLFVCSMGMCYVVTVFASGFSALFFSYMFNSILTIFLCYKILLNKTEKDVAVNLVVGKILKNKL